MSHIALSLNQFRQIARTPDASARVDLDASGQALQLAAATPVTANLGGLQASVAPKPGHNEASVNAFFKALEQGFGQDIAEKALQGLKGVQVAAGKLQVDSSFDLTVAPRFQCKTTQNSANFRRLLAPFAVHGRIYRRFDGCLACLGR